MLKKTAVALTFVAALALAGLGVSSTAEAGGCPYGGPAYGGYGGYGGYGPSLSYGVGYGIGYPPIYGPSYRSYYGFPSRRAAFYGPRRHRGLRFSIGF